MTREDLDFIGSMNMCDEISNEAYKKIMCHCEEEELCEDCISRQTVKEMFQEGDMMGAYIFLGIDDLPSVTPQEPKTDILDKIRAEIAVLDDADYDYEGYYKAVTDALQIIDKYRQEG